MARPSPDPLGSDESAPRHPIIRTPVGDVEHSGQVGLVDADAGVVDAGPCAVLVGSQRQLDLAALRRVRNGVGHQIRQHPNQRPVAANHPHRLGRQVRRQQHPGALGGDPVRGHHVVDDLVERHLVVGGLNRACVDLRHLEQVVDHLREPNRFLFNGFRVDTNVLLVGDHAVGYRLRHRADPGQRRAQVVADERDQPTSGLLGGAFGIADLLLPHRAAGLVAGHHDRGGDRHDRDDHQHDGGALERLGHHEPAGSEHAGEGRDRRDQHQRHHADRQRPRPGQPDDQRTGHYYRHRAGQRPPDDLPEISRRHVGSALRASAHRRSTGSRGPTPSAPDAGRPAWTAAV